MAFWGIEVKPGKPYTHSSKNGSGRLRISQATLAIGTAQLKSLVQCNVGDKRPVLLCALLPNKTESLQLDLEFDEAEDVIFSVVGPRGVYLTGYYVGHNRYSHMQDNSESFGEDIGNSETNESNDSTGEDEYEDSFINDDEPEPLTPSPVSSNKDDDANDDDDEGDIMKNRNGNGHLKRLKKKYKSIESDDEMRIPEVEDDDEDDFRISTLCKNNKSEESAEKINKETISEVEEKAKENQDNCKLDAVNSQVLDSKDMVDVPSLDEKTDMKEDQLNLSIPSIDEVMPEKKSKRNKKKKDSSKEEKVADVLDAKDDQKPADMGEVLTSADVDSEKNLKPKKKRKRRSEVNIDVTDNNMVAENKLDDDQQTADKSSGVDSSQLANGNQSDEKKVKKKRKKASKTQVIDGNANVDVEKENNKQSSTEPESFNKKTLSNGLVIEDLATGNSEGKVAAAGRKVKVHYAVKLKENGQVINSNGDTPHKFRLGDKEVIEGLNVGLEGMRVGDKRRLTIPPSMSLGYKGDGENVPPNSWLVYDVEMISIH